MKTLTKQNLGGKDSMKDYENITRTDGVDWTREYDKLVDETNCQKEKHHIEMEKLQDELERCTSELEFNERLNEIYYAKMEVVELIFGKGRSF